MRRMLVIVTSLLTGCATTSPLPANHPHPSWRTLCEYDRDSDTKTCMAIHRDLPFGIAYVGLRGPFVVTPHMHLGTRPTIQLDEGDVEDVSLSLPSPSLASRMGLSRRATLAYDVWPHPRKSVVLDLTGLAEAHGAAHWLAMGGSEH